MTFNVGLRPETRGKQVFEEVSVLREAFENGSQPPISETGFARGS